MENSPGILFWMLAVVSVVTAVVSVTAKRAIYVAVALVLLVLSVLNLLILLDLFSLAFIYCLMALVVLAVLAIAIKRSVQSNLLSFELKSEKKQLFYFVISILIFIGCLLLVSETNVWQYATETITLTFFGLISKLTEFYLLPFVLFKSFLLLLLIVLIYNLKEKTD